MRIATLTAADAPAYRELMLEAYERAADAFTSTVEERLAEPLAWWEKRIVSADGLSQGFGAFADDRLVGAVALEFSAKPKTCHSVLLLGMYLRPHMRGQGVARRLMQAAVAGARARPGVQRLHLTVTEGNEAAIGLYRSVGFDAWGVEPMALLAPGGFRGRVYMSMPLG